MIARCAPRQVTIILKRKHPSFGRVSCARCGVDEEFERNGLRSGGWVVVAAPGPFATELRNLGHFDVNMGERGSVV
jgi:hypothetical protein